MKNQFYTGKLKALELAENPIGEGGEGSVYEVIQPIDYQGYVVKIYKNPEQNGHKQAKIEYLIKYSPKLKNPFSVIFPEDIIYENGQFVGFLMKKAKGEYDLTSLCTLGNSTRLPQAWHHKFDRNTAEGIHNRLKICYNIASALSQIYALKKITLVDLKPENIKVSFQGEVSLVDIDSVGIYDEEEVLFPAEKITQEYSPIEWRETRLETDIVEETWDRFSIAVIFYKILLGLHPFAGTCRHPYNHLTSNEQKIAEGLFPLGEKKIFFDSIPEPHQKFKELPRAVRQLFLQCFENGHRLPYKRPSIAEWCKIFRHAKPKDYYLSLFKAKTTKVTKVDIPKPQKSESKSNLARVNSNSGILPSILISGTFMLGAVGFIQYNQQLGIQRLNVKYGNLENVVKISRNQERMSHVEKHQFVEFFNGNVTWVMDNYKFGLIDKDGKQLTEAKYDWTSKFHEGIARVKIGHTYAYINNQGKEITAFKYETADDFMSGVAIASRNENYYFIDKTGKELFPLDFDYIEPYKDNLANFRKNDLWGFIDRNGKTVIEAQYERAYPFSDGVAMVKQHDKYGYVDKTGKVIIPIQFESATSFSQGTAKVNLNGENLVINKNGQDVTK